MRFELVTLSRMGAMWYRASLVGVIFPLCGSLGTLTNRCVPFCLFPRNMSEANAFDNLQFVKRV